MTTFQNEKTGTRNSIFYDLIKGPGLDPGFGQGGWPQLPRPKVADVASYLWLGSCLRALEAFGFQCSNIHSATF